MILVHQLFKRTTRSVVLTDFGKIFHERCIRIMADLDDAETIMRESGNALKGRVRMVAPSSFGRVTVIPALPLLYERYPDLALEISFRDKPIDFVLRKDSISRCRPATSVIQV